jgi:predicted nucleotidyltransferase
MTNKIAGIVAEWNPFHRGHEAMIEELKKNNPDMAIFSVMSGCFVQRGDPALFDSWTRAKWAVDAGADAVFELPVLASLQSADRFAEEGARLLYFLGCGAIYFGTESLEAEELEEAASYGLTEEWTDSLHQFLKEGLSYAQASAKAMEVHSLHLAKELTKPNNLLGYRYATAILAHHWPLTIHVFHRDMEHNISATTARKELLEKGATSLLPSRAAEEAAGLMEQGNFTDFHRYEEACLLASRLMDEKVLSATGLFTEGLEHKWFRESQRVSYKDMLDHIKSKRYLYSRLKRIGAQLLIGGAGPSPFIDREIPSYARLLALRREKSRLLNDISIPLITSMAKALRTLPPVITASLLLDIRASDIRSWCLHGEKYRQARQEFYRSPIVV